MSEMFPVRYDVPLVPIARKAAGRRKWPVETMKPGGFFFVPGRPNKTVSAYISRITKDLPGKYTARPCWAFKDHRDGSYRTCEHTAVGAEEGVGVWRTE